MLKKIGLPLMALAGILAVAPHQAEAAVRFGVYVGAPAYTVRAPYVRVPAYVAPAYVAPAPVYVHRDWDRARVVRRWDRDDFHRFDRR